MKTLIFNGSARKNGRTVEMINFMLEHLPGEVESIRCYDLKISPCVDCRSCMKKPGCAIKDEMQDIYKKIDSCQNVVFAAPVYFHSVPAPMKTMIDRLQPYWAAQVRQDKHLVSAKKSGVILAGGAPGFENQFLPSRMLLNGVFGDLNASCQGVVAMDGADNCTLNTRPELQTAIKDICNSFKL